MADSKIDVVNAYTNARKITTGCQHGMGCKCETPFWLRDPTVREKEFEKVYAITESLYRPHE